MSTFYLRAGGGAGDFIYHYFRGYIWQRLAIIKAHYGCNLTAMLTCHNPSVAELVYTNPHIDSVMTYKWFPPGHPKEDKWKSMIAGRDLAEWARENDIRGPDKPELDPKVWLTDAEKKLMKELQSKGKYVVIHPFAGMPHRGCRPHPYDNEYKCYPDYKYVESANYLADAGYQVYIVGRTSRDGQDLWRCLTEELPLSNVPLDPKVTVLVDKVSFRVNVELVRRANGFLGTHSSMLSAAWTNDVPSVFFYPGYDEHGNRRTVAEHGGDTGTWALDKPIHNGYELNPAEFLKLNSRDPVTVLIKYM